MIQGSRIGCGITTYRRPEALARLCASLPLELIDALVIVNDDPDQRLPPQPASAQVIHNPKNLGVGRSKNKALSWLMAQQVEHIFLLEDDIFIKRADVFARYIAASRLSGIQHFNHCPFGPVRYNLTADGQSAPSLRLHLQDDLAIALYPEIVAPFSYYSRQCLETVGLFDESYYNAVEHVEHTLRIILHGMHPPFWFFADLADAQDYIGGEAWSFEQSVISANTEQRGQILAAADQAFERKYGLKPVQIAVPTITEVMQSLAAIRQRFGASVTMA